jgi:hypothetical protein
MVANAVAKNWEARKAAPDNVFVEIRTTRRKAASDLMEMTAVRNAAKIAPEITG